MSKTIDNMLEDAKEAADRLTDAQKMNGKSMIFKDDAGNTVCRIGEYDMFFFESLRDLPPWLKIKMMNLTDEDLQQDLDRRTLILKATCITLLSKKWYWRETGEEADVFPDNVNELQYTQKELLKKLLSKKFCLTNKHMNSIIEYFTSGREVYCND